MMLSLFSNGSVETESSVTRSSTLLDTDVESDVCALGITEKSTQAEIMAENDKAPSQLNHGAARVNSTVKAGNVPACETQQQPQTHQLFDFVHIRYQRSGIQDGARIFRLAFEQTKPGGWIEVVETGPVAAPQARLHHLSKPSSLGQSPPAPLKAVPHLPTPDETALLIKRQLLNAGFVDVEQKGWRSTSSTAGICHRIAGAARCFKSCGEMQITVDEKGLSSSCSSSRIFVIARHPLKDA
ncbi:hypothetical protein BGX38DRAFT_252733 [Terfezia claveryi]|nr:hypothetical protein BGX38DRAFT_555141 [Terfezia claveryi]KAF8454739.1 hypothetical protein BGX38DRAFT_252733 [Terfezia claveryi]